MPSVTAGRHSAASTEWRRRVVTSCLLPRASSWHKCTLQILFSLRQQGPGHTRQWRDTTTGGTMSGFQPTEHQHVRYRVHTSASKSSFRRFVITEKAPTRAFSWLKAATTAFTFKTLLRHYAKRALTPQSLNVKLCPRRNYHKGRAAIRHYANQPAHPLWPLHPGHNFTLRDTAQTNKSGPYIAQFKVCVGFVLRMRAICHLVSPSVTFQNFKIQIITSCITIKWKVFH